MGIMGTTPNIVVDYSLLHPDHEEYWWKNLPTLLQTKMKKQSK
jgi:hypothetical protein